VIADEALRWTLAVLLLAATLYSAGLGLNGTGQEGRVGSVLHALMTAAMALMLVPSGQWPVLPQLLLFAVGAWWFVLQAVRLRKPSRAHNGTHSRDRRPMSGKGKPIYDAAAMAAMVFMLAATRLWELTPSGALPPASGPLISAPHHGSAAAMPLAVPPPAWGTQTAVVLAVVFGLAALHWTARLLLQLWPGPRGLPATTAIQTRSPGPGTRHLSDIRDVADTAVEVVGAAAFALMFAALAA
jgi:hypothetical protein